jgi:leucyl-tRNA synthetase
MKWLGKFVFHLNVPLFHLVLVDQFTVCNNWSLFTWGLISFTIVKMSKFTQNLVKPRVNYMYFGVMTMQAFFLSSAMEIFCHKKITNWNLELGRIFDIKGFLFTYLYFVLTTNVLQLWK